MSSEAYDLEDFGSVIPPEADPTAKKSFKLPDEIKTGDRGDTIRKLLRSQKARGVSFEAAKAACEIENRNRCKPPLDDKALEYDRWWDQPDQPEFASGGSKGATTGRSHLTKLINLIVKSDAELFMTPTGSPHVTMRLGNYIETLSLEGSQFKERLARLYYAATKSGVGGGALGDAAVTLCGIARESGITMPVYTRVAAIEGCVYVDLLRDDRYVLTITAAGWGVAAAPQQIRFVHRPGMLPLPMPLRSNETVAALLSRVINVKANSPDMMLLIGWLVGALRGLKPYPILAIAGEHGTGKTAACRYARQTLDPNQADLSSAPKESRDLMIAALNSHVIGFDNLSFIHDWLSDDLCRLATGAGFRTRKLHTDDKEMIFAAARPVVMNAIADVVRRGDLMDRAITITLSTIDDRQRRTEADVAAEFHAAQPGIIAALADAVAQALRLPVTLDELPRMADFAITVESAAPALGWKPGAFLEAYAERRDEAVAMLLEGDPVAVALNSLYDRLKQSANGIVKWEGTTPGLREKIFEQTPEAKHKDLPKSDRALIGALRRLAPGLRQQRIQIDLPVGQERSGDWRGKRIVRIRWEDSDDALGRREEAAAALGTDGTHGTDDTPF
jgi:hypothetical protein